MKKINFSTAKRIILAAVIMSTIISCKVNNENTAEAEETNEGSEGLTEVFMNLKQINALDIKTDSLYRVNFHDIVEANGQLQVPPQNKASVTAVVGANVKSIKVFTGDKVSKGSLLATLTHPRLIQMQTNYLSSVNRFDYLEKEYERQKKLYEAQVGSGKNFQRVSSEYFSLKSDLKNLETQLRLLNMSPEKIKNGQIQQSVPVLSPIDGYVDEVNVNIGQYAEPQKTMFVIINNDRIHADLMVFEKDVHKVKIGQQVNFFVASRPGKMLKANIFAVGKSFRSEPKAVHIHASFKNKGRGLIPGMYITGYISTGDKHSFALPESAVISEGGKEYVFSAGKKKDGMIFSPVEVKTGQKEKDFVELTFMDEINPGMKFVSKGAYYIISEMKKSETGDDD